MNKIRTAVVRSKNAKLETVQRYLPGNYSAVAVRNFGDDYEDRPELVVIVGTDNAGFTLNDYILPRLASGLIGAEEVR